MQCAEHSAEDETDVVGELLRVLGLVLDGVPAPVSRKSFQWDGVILLEVRIVGAKGMGKVSEQRLAELTE